MTGLDCNILVALAYADHPANRKTVAAVLAERQRSPKLLVAPLTVTEFLHIVTDERRFSPAFTMPEAVEWIERFMANPGMELLASSAESLRLTLRWMKEFRLGRKRILDTHLTAILHLRGVRRLLTANPSDFAVFDVLETVVP
jgi:predicted nucleic acid-binding protein